MLTLLTEIMLRAPNKAATEAAIVRNSLAESSRRNAEVLTAMGMTGRMATRWGDANRKYMANQGRASDVAGGLGSISKVLRMMLQSGVLAVGAYLVIHQEATAGIIIAGSILSARALAPVDLAIANWRGFTAARSAWGRLNKLLAALPARAAPMALQPPTHAPRRSKASAARRPASRKSSCRTSPSSSRPARGSASSARAAPASRRWRGCWSGSGSRCAAACASTARRSTNGRPTRSARISAICRRTSSLLTGTVAQNIARFEPSPTTKPSLPPPRRPACMT